MRRNNGERWSDCGEQSTLPRPLGEMFPREPRLRSRLLPGMARKPPPLHRHAQAGEKKKPAGRGFSGSDDKDIEEASKLRAPVIYETLRREGEDEMDRPFTSLWWSGVAAGLSISFSLLAQAILKSHLPDTPWRPLISDLGYSVGFLMVILARQQLFTENTITAVLPFIATPGPRALRRLARMWGIVLSANLAGAFFAALFCTFTPAVSPEIRHTMVQISVDSTSAGALDTFFLGISAGFLMAAMVWLLPSAEGAQFLVITLVTYLIAIGGFAHIVAGSVETFMLVVGGREGIGWALVQFLLPALAGNIVGGSALFAVIAYGQVAKEV